MAELGDFLISSENTNVPIEIDMLDYDYVKNCYDTKKLKGILNLLKSGKEGIYPDLEKFVEEKLLSLLPAVERNRILRMKQEVSPFEISEAENGLRNWEEAVNKVDEELKSHSNGSSSKKTLPPVRGVKREKLDVAVRINQKSTSANGDNQNTSKDKRLSGYDFAAWEKFDVDDALSKVEDGDDSVSIVRRKAREHEDAQNKKRTLKHEAELEKLRNDMHSHLLTDMQCKTRSIREKQKGNEAYRAGENEDALGYYSRSLALDPGNAVVYANRAMVYLRLNMLEMVEDDCSRALHLDKTYNKAYQRRGMARFKQGKYEGSIQDFRVALQGDPSNKEIEKLLDSALNKFKDVEGREYSTDYILSINKVTESSRLHLPDQYDEIISSGSISSLILSAGPEFTRVAIAIDDDDSDEGEDDEKGEGGQASSPVGDNSFTRVPIHISDGEGEEDEKAPPGKDTRTTRTSDGSKMTKIVIAEGSSSEDEEEVKVERNAELDPVLLKEQGNAEMKEKNYAKAIELYSLSIDIDDSSDAATGTINNRALAYLQIKNYQKSCNDCLTVLAKEPRNLKALLRRSMAYEGLGEFDAALSDLKKLLSFDPVNAQAKKNLVALENKIKSSAVSSYSSAANISNQDSNSDYLWKVESLKREALKYLQNGNSSAAVTVLLEAIAVPLISYGDKEMFVSLKHLLSSAYLSLSKDAEALDSLSGALEIDPNNFKALIKSGQIHLNMGSIDKAKDFAQRALRIDSSDVEALMLMDSLNSGSNAKAIPAPPTAEELRAQSNHFKDGGNEAMKKNSFDEAIYLYTRAIDVDPSNILCFNNRAQAYLKTSRFVEAERDSTEVIRSSEMSGSESLPAVPNIKAVFRRALARKGLGGRVKLTEALQDLDIILINDPNNKEALSEKMKVLETLKNHQNAGVLSPPLPPAPSSRTSHEKPNIVSTPPAISQQKVDIGLSERSTTTKKREEAVNVPVTSPSKNDSPASEVIVASPSHTPLKGSVREAKPLMRSSPVIAPMVPTEPPKTLYELERVWRGLKTRTNLFASYLKTFKKSTFKKVIKEACSPDLLSSIFSAVDECLVHSDPDIALTILEGLSSIPNFQLTSSLFPAEDIEHIRNSLKTLSKSISEDKYLELTTLYKVN